MLEDDSCYTVCCTSGMCGGYVALKLNACRKQNSVACSRANSISMTATCRLGQLLVMYACQYSCILQQEQRAIWPSSELIHYIWVPALIFEYHLLTSHLAFQWAASSSTKSELDDHLHTSFLHDLSPTRRHQEAKKYKSVCYFSWENTPDIVIGGAPLEAGLLLLLSN